MKTTKIIEHTAAGKRGMDLNELKEFVAMAQAANIDLYGTHVEVSATWSGGIKVLRVRESE